MRRRCNNPKNKGYSNYGGRGIIVCQQWNDFDTFLRDMGYRPPGLTIERIDVNGNYDPFNCTWIPKNEQPRNTRKSIAARKRFLENPPIKKWERQAQNDIKKKLKTEYVPQSPVHGSKKMYHKHKCRCDICVEGFRRRLKQKPSYSNPENLQRKSTYLKTYRKKKKLTYDL